MPTLWLAIDIAILVCTAYIANVLIQRADTPNVRIKVAIKIIAIYSLLIVGVYVYMMYDTGYTLFGAMLFGGAIASLHIIVLGGFVMIVLSS